MIDIEELVERIGGITDPDCRAVLDAYVKLTSVLNRSGRVSEADKAEIAFAVLEVAEHRPPRDSQGLMNVRLLAIDAMRVLAQRLATKPRTLH